MVLNELDDDFGGGFGVVLQQTVTTIEYLVSIVWDFLREDFPSDFGY